MINLNKGNARDKLFQVLKALSAMRLTKEDSVPNAYLHRVKSDSDRPYCLSPLAGKEDEHEMKEILGEPCLFQGSIGAAYNKASLMEHGITHILTCASNISPRFPNIFKYKILDLLDSPTQNIVSSFNEAHEFIENALSESNQNKVLVHCFAGKSRASTISLSYLMKY